MVLLSTFAGLAIVLTIVGLYGVMMYSVARRTREIGIRMALGAQRSLLLKMILREAAVLLGTGIAIGLAWGISLGFCVEEYVVRHRVAQSSGSDSGLHRGGECWSGCSLHSCAPRRVD